MAFSRPLPLLFGLTNGSAASSRAGGVGQVGVVGQGRRAGGAPFGLDSPGRPRYFLASLHRLLAAGWAVPASISATWGPVVCHRSLCPSAGGTLGCGSPDRGAGPQQMPYWGNMGPWRYSVPLPSPPLPHTTSLVHHSTTAPARPSFPHHTTPCNNVLVEAMRRHRLANSKPRT